MTVESDETRDVLRGVWNNQGQSKLDIDETSGPRKICKRMVTIGFDDMAGESGDLRAAWRSRLEREGKLSSEPGSIRDLVLGPQEGR